MEELRAYLKAQGWGSQKRLVQQLGIHHSTMTRWLSGERRPDDDMKTKIRAVTGIAEAAWFAPVDDESA